jgi:aspartate kinase
VEAIRKQLEPDEINVTSGLAIIATVGQGMNHYIGVAARLTGAMAQARINLRVLDQGSSEMNIIIGVEEQDLQNAVRAIYEAFDAWE